MCPQIQIIHQDATLLTGYSTLVVPTNKQLSLKWGSHLGEKVFKLAGKEVEQEALMLHPAGINLGEAVLTHAGKMKNFSFLIHGAVLDKYNWNPLHLLKLAERTSTETLQKVMVATLKIAQEKKIPSLVFTPMGSGIGGMKTEKCANIMILEVKKLPNLQHF